MKSAQAKKTTAAPKGMPGPKRKALPKADDYGPAPGGYGPAQSPKAAIGGRGTYGPDATPKSPSKISPRSKTK